MKQVAVAFALALLTGCASITPVAVEGSLDQTLPEGVTEAEVAEFRAAVAATGCNVGSMEASQIAARTGFDRAKLQIITQFLRLAGETELTDAGFRLTTGPCANA